MRSAKPIVPPLTFFVTAVIIVSVDPLSHTFQILFTSKKNAADIKGYLVATNSGFNRIFSFTI